MTGNYENFDMAMQDKVHQPYRAQLIDGMEEIFRHAKDFWRGCQLFERCGLYLDGNGDKGEGREIRKRNVCIPGHPSA